jgi:erythronate-4-phosphate dehydrogenase
MKIVADQNMPLLAETFGRHGEVQLLKGREICRADLAGAEVLLVRSVTRVNESLLSGTGIRFVGSATIGIDHLDTAWLEANNITWAHAPGCNANAASQYALAMMWLACERLQRDFRRQTVGIIGRGNVGGRLEHLLKVLNIPVMSCDPPLQDRGEQQLVSLDEVCANSIISLHVPLTSSGEYPTENLLDFRQLEKLKPNTLLVNTSRGGVIEKFSLMEQLDSGRLQAALDVWPDEPFIEAEMLNAVTVATPHVAGYSREGKQAGTEMIYQAFRKAFALSSPTEPTSNIETVILDFPPATSTGEVLEQSIQSSSQVIRDDAALRELPPVSQADNRVHIDSLRAAYPERYEFKSHLLRGLADADKNLMKQLGFKTA